MNKKALQANLPKSILFVLGGYLLYGGVLEFYNVAWGTGIWWGEFSFKWAAFFILFAGVCVLCLFALWFALWRDFENLPFLEPLLKFRNRMGLTRHLAEIILLILPIWLLQYTVWGVVFSKPYMRMLIWSFTVIFLAFFFTNDKNRAWTRSGFIAAVFFSTVCFTLAVPLKNVTSYPFSLGWSEGNRMWDYSLLFGKGLYTYSADKEPVAYIDFGRQLSGGLPFLFPRMTILLERLWLAMMTIVPYVLLGLIAFRLPGTRSKLLPFFAGLWAWMFLNQGPIHAPLLWCAILVALVWGRPLWFAVPLIAISAYFATISRSTWVFAPAMWAGMLELGSVPPRQFRINLQTWGRAIAVVLAGLAGGPFSTTLAGLYHWLVTFLRSDGASSAVPSIIPGTVTITSVTSAVTEQPLLWYRLFPNATYGNGILFGLLIAVVPVTIVLLYLYLKRVWILNIWQKLVIILSLSAFLLVGLIVSTKIGGGADLHNMDMFLVGMMFSAALAWRKAGFQWFEVVESSPHWARLVFLLLIALPALKPLMTMRPISFAGDAEWLITLADVNTPRALGLLPSNTAQESALEMIRQAVQEAQTRGDVLFMDQRQLLTFGYIQDVTLVGEYEKKRLMDEALSDNAAYFELYYRDLAAHRFSLIISDPLRTPIKDSDYQFGEENNAWVKWVSNPVLCYYEEKENLKEVGVQLLVPKQNPPDCLTQLP